MKLIHYILPMLVSLLVFVNIGYELLPIPEKIKKYYPQIERSSDLKKNGGLEIAEFVKTYTDTADVFLTPPDFGSFRTVAHRSIIADLECFSFRSDRLVEWWNRINDCYGDFTDLSSNLMKSEKIYAK